MGHVIDMNATTNTSVVCKFDQARNTPVGSLKVYGKNKRLIKGNSGGGSSQYNPSADTSIDFRKRVPLCAWKPIDPADSANEKSLALVFRNCIYLYQNCKGQPVSSTKAHLR